MRVARRKYHQLTYLGDDYKHSFGCQLRNVSVADVGSSTFLNNLNHDDSNYQHHLYLQELSDV